MSKRLKQVLHKIYTHHMMTRLKTMTTPNAGENAKELNAHTLLMIHHHVSMELIHNFIPRYITNKTLTYVDQKIRSGMF